MMAAVEAPEGANGTAAPQEPKIPSTLAEGWVKGYYITPELEDCGEDSGYRSLNGEAVWTLSSARPGNGVDCLLDDNTDTFWQSDGTSPHTISIQFYKRESVAEVALYVEFASDDTYCPNAISVRAGYYHHDTEELRRVMLVEPAGWVRLPLGDPAARGAQRYLRCWYLQLVFHSMHGSGRDVHVRAIRVLAPKQPPHMPPAAATAASDAAMPVAAAADEAAAATASSSSSAMAAAAARISLPQASAFLTSRMAQFAEIR